MAISFKTTRNIGLLGMTAIILIMALTSFITTTRIVNGLNGILQKERPKLELVERIRNCFLDAREIFNAFIKMEEKDINAAVRLMNEAIKESEKLKELIPEEKQQVDKFITAAKRFRLATVSYAEEAQVDITGARAREMEKIALATAKEVEGASAKLVRDIRAKIKATDEIMLGVSKNNQRMSLAGMLIGVVAGLSVAFFMGRGLSRPIRQLVNGTQRIAKGDLDYRIKVESGDEIGQFSDAFNKMTEDLSVYIQKEKELAASEKEKAAELTKEIAERKKTEEQIQKQKEFIERIINSLQYPFYVINTDYSLVLCNRVAREKGVVEGGYCYQLTHHRQEPCSNERVCPLKEVVRIKKPVVVEHIHYDKDGNQRVIEVYGDPIFDKDGEVVQMIEYCIDITERKKAEEELKKAYAELEATQDQLIQAEKLNAVGQLASGIAHEVRNPLGIILQGVNYLEKKMPATEKDIFETLTMLKDSIGRADKIINALFEFSRATRLNLQPEDVNSILESSLSLVKARLKFANIDIIMETKKDIPSVLVDKNKLEQVFINILLNAVQAMPSGGKVIIRSFDKKLEEIKNGIGKRAQDNFQLGEQAVIVEVEDTGIGIPEENLKRIFDPFFTTKGPTGGAGLGLSVTRNIIYMHKGLIFAESKVDKGTKITVLLKIAQR